jgi:ribonuclease PH
LSLNHPCTVDLAAPASYSATSIHERLTMRPSGRAPDQMRAITIEPGFTRHAEGSCLVGFGDTRTASISGGWVALRLAIDGLIKAGTIATDPLGGRVAAVSCGIHDGTAVLDLDYVEDSAAGTDANFVLAEGDGLIEVQATAEGAVFSEEDLLRLLRLARIGCGEIFAAQNRAVGR